MALKTPIVPRTGNGTRSKTETEQPKRAQEVKPDKIEDTNLPVADFSPSDEEPKRATPHNVPELTADFLHKMIEQKEAQITVLEADIVALRRTADILST